MVFLFVKRGYRTLVFFCHHIVKQTIVIRKNTLIGLAMCLPFLVNAQKEKDVQNIMNLCGCYDVKFEYAETFRTDSAYQFHKGKIASAKEFIMPIEQTDGKISLQHMLIVSEHHIIKHWREDWTYQQPELLSYQGDNTWQKETISNNNIKGTWTQTIWQVDDMPRYQGYSKWIENDGKTYWESTAYAPLPRREYTTRDDYNIMKRTNKIVVTDNGWLHEQDNEKIIRENGKDSLLVEEKGYNRYTKIDNSECAAAKQHWEDNKEFWSHVRNRWDKYTADGELKLKTKVEDQMLFEHFYTLAYNWRTEKWNSKKLEKEIDDIMSKFVIN